MSVADLVWILLLVSAIQPLLANRVLQAQRVKAIRALEKQRGSRVITLIHRRESLALFGIPFTRYIDIEDSEQILRAIRLTPPDMPIDLILHTPGGLVLAVEQIAMALARHPGKVTVFVPHYAMSGGTLIALAADEIVLDQNAVLGPVDPQLGEFPAASIIRATEKKRPEDLEDRTLILADVAEKALRQVEDFITRLVADRMGEERARQLAKALSEGRWTHDYPITAEEAKELGLPVSTDLPEAVHQLMSLYPQPPQRRPTVQYIPVPYRRAPGEPPTPPRGSR